MKLNLLKTVLDKRDVPTKSRRSLAIFSAIDSCYISGLVKAISKRVVMDVP